MLGVFALTSSGGFSMPCGHDEAYLVMVCSGCWVLQKECPSSMLKLPHLRVGLTVFCRVRIVGHFDLSEVCIWPKWRYSKWSGPAASAIHPTHKATSHTHTHCDNCRNAVLWSNQILQLLLASTSFYKARAAKSQHFKEAQS